MFDTNNHPTVPFLVRDNPSFEVGDEVRCMHPYYKGVSCYVAEKPRSDTCLRSPGCYIVDSTEGTTFEIHGTYLYSDAEYGLLVSLGEISW